MSSSARTRPKACRSPSTRSIDARGQVVHAERLDEISAVPQVEHADEGLHADVGRCNDDGRSEEHTSELQSRLHLVCRLLLEKKKNKKDQQSVSSVHQRY